MLLNKASGYAVIAALHIAQHEDEGPVHSRAIAGPGDVNEPAPDGRRWLVTLPNHAATKQT
jgi:hypothetical protein